MSKADVKVIRGQGPIRRSRVDDRTTSGTTATIKYGEPIKRGGTGNNFAILLATGEPQVGSTIQPMLGIAQSESTETSSADGIVAFYSVIPGRTELRAKATTSSNINTDAKILALEHDYVTFDLVSGVFTIDEDEGDDPNVRGLQILRGDSTALTLDVLVHALVTEAAPLTGQTMD
jgi:hypothetical protein